MLSLLYYRNFRYRLYHLNWFSFGLCDLRDWLQRLDLLSILSSVPLKRRLLDRLLLLGRFHLFECFDLLQNGKLDYGRLISFDSLRFVDSLVVLLLLVKMEPVDVLLIRSQLKLRVDLVSPLEYLEISFF